MEQWLINHETAIGGYAFYGTLALVALWESLKPAKPPTTSTPVRWLNNIALVVLDNLVIRWVFPLLAVAFSILVADNGWGLFNAVSWPLWLMFPVTVLILDLTAYVFHRLLHTVPLLWRLHKVHHADLDYDITTALRFHPLESLVTVGSTLLAIAALGAPPVAVMTYQVLILSGGIIVHGNIHLPPKLDSALRLCIVTPDMHRIHHSVDFREGNSNFAGIFSVWDHLFGTYIKDPAAGKYGMVIGLADYMDARSLNLHRLLIMPFTRQTSRDAAMLAGAPFDSDRQRS
jgi:sterol desaturase/sphingolipid hydroxylase (fatty acid hydroxylase superfamily)